MSSVSQGTMIAGINIAFTDANAVPASQFDGSRRGIWIRNTEGMSIDGMPLLDPYFMDVNEVTYQLGVHKKFNNFCEKYGWYCEQYDAGTLMVYPDC